MNAPAARPAPAVGAVILNHNDAGNARRLCAALCACPAVGRVVVADNSDEGRGAGPSGGAKSETMTVPNRGYAAGCNAGARRLLSVFPAEYLIFSNPDVVVSCRAVSACVGFLETHPGCAVAAPRMLRADGSPHPMTGWREKRLRWELANACGPLYRLWGGGEVYPPGHWRRPAAEADCVAGAFFVVRRRAFEQAGGFDEGTFLFYEEDILGHRLRAAGWKLAVLGGEIYTHLEGISYDPSPRAVLRRARAMQKSRLYFQRRVRRVRPAGLLALRAAGWAGYLGKILRAAALAARHSGA